MPLWYVYLKIPLESLLLIAWDYQQNSWQELVLLLYAMLRKLRFVVHPTYWLRLRTFWVCSSGTSEDYIWSVSNSRHSRKNDNKIVLTKLALFDSNSEHDSLGCTANGSSWFSEDWRDPVSSIGTGPNMTEIWRMTRLITGFSAVGAYKIDSGSKMSAAGSLVCTEVFV